MRLFASNETMINREGQIAETAKWKKLPALLDGELFCCDTHPKYEVYFLRPEREITRT